MTEPDRAAPALERALVAAAGAERGHFAYESGHHGDLWLNLDALFLDARRVRDWAAALARSAARCRAELVCGPLTGGAFLAQAVAAELGASFLFAERLASAGEAVQYRVPAALRRELDRKRVLLVDDAVNAGSALLSTLSDVLACGAEVTGFACLITLGGAAGDVARQEGVPLHTLASLERGMWTPAECPLCRSGVPLAAT